jgi:hypothetical protein
MHVLEHVQILILSSHQTFNNLVGTQHSIQPFRHKLGPDLWVTLLEDVRPLLEHPRLRLRIVLPLLLLPAFTVSSLPRPTTLLEPLKEGPAIVLGRKGEQRIRLQASRLRQDRFPTELKEEGSETMLPLKRGSVMSKNSSVEPEIPILVVKLINVNADRVVQEPMTTFRLSARLRPIGAAKAVAYRQKPGNLSEDGV